MSPIVDVVVVVNIGDGISSRGPSDQSYVLSSASLQVPTSVRWAQAYHLRKDMSPCVPI